MASPEKEEKLFTAYVTDTLTPAQRKELTTHLREHPAAQDRLIDFITDTGLFIEVGGDLESLQRSTATFTVGELLDRKARRATKAHSPKPIWIGVAAAAALLIAGLIATRNSPKAPPEANPFARIDATSTDQTDTALTPGKWLEATPIKLDEGTVSLTLNNGVALTLAAPLDAVLESPQRLTLNKGAVAAHVPPQAAGFTVTTPHTGVVDLGTAFTVNAHEPDRSIIHVTEGKIELWPSNEALSPQRVVAGQAFSVSADELRPIKAPAQAILENPMDVRLQQPNRYLHWDFNEEKGQLISDGGENFGNRFPLQFANKSKPKWVDGPFDQALWFDGKKSALSSNFPGITANNDRTVAFWVKVPPNATKQDSHALVAWGKPHGNESGAKWQIAWNAAKSDGVVGALRTEVGLGFVIGSTDLRDGRWHHVAIVLIGSEDANVSSHVRQYVDGELESISGTQARIINTASGFEDKSHPLTVGRNLDNKTNHARMGIDELFVIDHALMPHEIRHLMQHNELP
jgi:hypothetical protein